MNKELLAIRLLGRPIRLMSVKGQKRVAMLRLEVTPFANERYAQSDSMRTLGCEMTLVIFDPKAFGRACKRGTVTIQGEKRAIYAYRIRNLTPRQLRRLAWRMLEYAELLEIASLSGIDLRELRKIWREIKAGKRRPRKASEGEEEEELPFDFATVEEEEEGVTESEHAGGSPIERD